MADVDCTYAVVDKSKKKKNRPPSENDSLQEHTPIRHGRKVQI